MCDLTQVQWKSMVTSQQEKNRIHPVWKGHSGCFTLSTQEGEQLGQQGGHLATRCEGGRTVSHYWEGESKIASSVGSGMSGWKTGTEVGKEVGGVRLYFAERWPGEFAGMITGR